jgi:MFS family permease
LFFDRTVGLKSQGNEFMSEQISITTEKKPSTSLSFIFHTPAFTALWLSEALSLVGDRLVMVALITLVYDRTGSAGAVGLLMVCKAIPALVLGSVAGVFVDRWNRKWIMVFANLLQGLLVFWLPFSMDIAVIFVIYLAMSIINQFFVPARSATIPDLVPSNSLLTANSLFAISFVCAMAIGPAIGTWITERFSLNMAFYVDAGTFLVPAIIVAFIVIPRQERIQAKFDLGKDLRAGFTFSISEPAVLVALSTITAAFFVIGTISVTGVVITREILHLESSKFGVMISILGVGMLIGAMISNWLKGHYTNVQFCLAGSVWMAIGIIVLPWSSTLTLACLFAAMIGMGMIIVQINGQMLLQTIAPEMRGRLLGISQMLTGSATFLASAIVGLLVEWFNVTFVMGTVGVIALIVTIAAAFRFRSTSKVTESRI